MTELKYDAITFDTQMVETNSFHFDGGLLNLLKQFRENPPQIILSSIVLAEILKRLTSKTREARDASEAAHRKSLLYGLVGSNSEYKGPSSSDIKDICRARVIKFFEEIGSEEIDPENVSINEVLKLYFAPRPPFSATGTKKHEFPDAIALLSLENWAKKNRRKILAISGDKDWAAYAAQSEFIDVVPNLEEALALVQDHSEEAKRIFASVISEIKNDAQSDLSSQFDQMLESPVTAHDYNVNANSFLEFEAEDVEVTYLSYDATPMSDFRIVEFGPNKIVAKSTVSIDVEAQAEFTFHVHDSIDDDYVSLGGSVAATEDRINVSILVEIGGDFSESNFEIENIQIVGPTPEINFGAVGPDYQDEFYEE